MTPAFGPFKSLEHYLQVRARDHGHNLSSLSEELGYGRSYLHSISSGSFRPSVKRCREIADYFDDHPDIILTLAGFREPPPTADPMVDAINRITSSLSPHLRQTVLEFVDFLKARQARETSDIQPRQVYVELPDGDSMTLDVEGDPLMLSKENLRLTLRAALNAALAQREEPKETEDTEDVE